MVKMKNLKMIQISKVEANFKSFSDLMDYRDFNNLVIAIELSDGEIVVASQVNHNLGQCDCCPYEIGDRTIIGYTTFVVGLGD
jgi:hypothetical protein